MQTVSVRGVSEASARTLVATLSAFRPQLGQDGTGAWRVTVTVNDEAAQRVALLNAIARHVSERGSNSADVEMDGRHYSLDPRLPEQAD